MDVLVIAGRAAPPEFLLARNSRVIDLPDAEVSPAVLADLRSRLPRRVTVVGPFAIEVAARLPRAGLPVRLYADEKVAGRLNLSGVEVLPATDPGVPMEVVGS